MSVWYQQVTTVNLPSGESLIREMRMYSLRTRRQTSVWERMVVVMLIWCQLQGTATTSDGA